MTPHGVVAPFCSGCEILIASPMKEPESEDPRAVIGLLDPSARAHITPSLLSFSAPWPRFLTMLENMGASFLNTYVWEDIRRHFGH